MPSSSPQLDYSPAPSRRRRRARRWVALLIVLAIATPVLWRLGRASYSLMFAHALYRQCAAFSAPSATPVYTEDPTQRDRLLKLPDYWIVQYVGGTIIFHVPQAWRDFNEIATSSRIRTWGTLFLHELKTPDGKQRHLIGVDLTRMSRDSGSITLSAVVRCYGTVPLHMPVLTHTTTETVSLRSGGGVVRIFPGQLDRSDPSHFTIAYTIDDKVGVIDGWLKNDDSILLEPRPVATTIP